MTDDLAGLVALEPDRAGVPAQHAAVEADHVDGIINDGIDEELEVRDAAGSFRPSIAGGHRIPMLLALQPKAPTPCPSKRFRRAPGAGIVAARTTSPEGRHFRAAVPAEPRQMRLAFRRRVLPRRRLLQHALDALGREALLRQRDAAVEHLAIARDAAVAEDEMPDALEYHRLALRARHRREVAEAVARIAAAAVAQRIEELPAEVGAGRVEVGEHAGDGRRSGIGAVEAVLVDAVGGEQPGQSGAVVALDRRREPLEQLRKFGHSRSLARPRACGGRALADLEHRQIFQQRDDADDDDDDLHDLLGAAVDRQHVDEIEHQDDHEKCDEHADENIHARLPFARGRCPATAADSLGHFNGADRRVSASERRPLEILWRESGPVAGAEPGRPSGRPAER